MVGKAKQSLADWWPGTNGKLHPPCALVRSRSFLLTNIIAKMMMHSTSLSFNHPSSGWFLLQTGRRSCYRAHLSNDSLHTRIRGHVITTGGHGKNCNNDRCSRTSQTQIITFSADSKRRQKWRMKMRMNQNEHSKTDQISFPFFK